MIGNAKPTRRDFLKWGGSAGVAFISALSNARPTAALDVRVGYATISWPQNQFPEALETISRLGYKGVQLLGWVETSYGGPKAQELRDRLTALKLKPVALSCWKLKLDPANLSVDTEKFRAYAAFFKSLGGLYLQVTDSGRPGVSYSAEEIKSLGAKMNELGKIAQASGLSLGYHPHFGTLGETREGMGRVLDATDPRYVKLIADVAHITLGGADPAEVIRTYSERLIFAHFKDVRKDVAELARQNRDLVRKNKYHFCEIGAGTVNFPAVLEAFRSARFRGWIIVELDGNEPRPGGPAESAEANKEAIAKLGVKV